MRNCLLLTAIAFSLATVWAQNGKSYWIHRQIYLEEGRSGAAAAAAGNYVLFAGGWSDSLFTNLASVEIYDANRSVWISHDMNLAEPRRSLSGGSLGSKAFFAGGEVFGTLVDILDTEDMRSTTYTMSQWRILPSVVNVGSRLFITGGGMHADYYDSSTHTWGVVELSWERDDTIAVADDRYLIFASENDFEVYDSQEGTTRIYTSKTGTPIQRGGLGITQKKAVFYRGDLLEIFDIESGEFTVRNLPTAGRTLSDFVVSASKAWIAGGKLASQAPSSLEFTNLVEAYDVSVDKWSTFTLQSSSRRIEGGVAVMDSVVFFGGEMGPTYSASPDVDIFDDSGRHAAVQGFNHTGSAWALAGTKLFVAGNSDIVNDEFVGTGIDMFEYFPVEKKTAPLPDYNPPVHPKTRVGSALGVVIFVLVFCGCFLLVSFLAGVKYYLEKKRRQQVEVIEQSTVELSTVEESKFVSSEDNKGKDGAHTVQIKPVGAV